MKGKHLSQLLLAATILATKDILSPVVPALAIPALAIPALAKATPEYSPNTPPRCQSIKVNQTGSKLPQEPGDVLLCQPSPPPTPPTNVVGTTTSRVVTTTTSTTEVRTVTTTTTTTIEATTTSSNTTVPMPTPTPTKIKPCEASELKNGTQYNWWQILLVTGGKPGTLKCNKNAENHVLDSPPIDPCVRPLQSQNPRRYSYRHRDAEWSTYIRKEIGYPRFYGTENEFMDVRGELIWRPPAQANDDIVYSVHYVLDDTGFWVIASALDCGLGKCNLPLILFEDKLDPLR